MSVHLRAAGLEAIQIEGMIYSLISDRWLLAADTDVNYLAAAVRPMHMDQRGI